MDTATYHINYKVRYDGTLFACTALMALNLLLVYSQTQF